MELLEQMRLEWDEMKRRNAGEYEQQRDTMSEWLGLFFPVQTRL